MRDRADRQRVITRFCHCQSELRVGRRGGKNERERRVAPSIAGMMARDRAQGPRHVTWEARGAPAELPLTPEPRGASAENSWRFRDSR